MSKLNFNKIAKDVIDSEIHALNTLGVNEVRIIGPHTLIPKEIEMLGVHVYHDMNSGLKDVDVVVMLRLQRERMRGALLPSENEYFKMAKSKIKKYANFSLNFEKIEQIGMILTILMGGNPMKISERR